MVYYTAVLLSLTTWSPMQSHGCSLICHSWLAWDRGQLNRPEAGTSVKLSISEVTPEKSVKVSGVRKISRDCLPKKSLPSQSVLVVACR